MHPELWFRWEEYLLEYAREHGLDEKWVVYGFWRWRRAPGDEKRLAERLGLDLPPDPRGAPVSLEVSEVREVETEIEVRGSLRGISGLESMAPLAEILGEVELSDNSLEIRAGGIRAVVREGGSLWARGSDKKELAALLERLWMVACRASCCIGCGSCVSSCPKGALDVERGTVELDSSKCSKCGRCNFACPIAVYSRHRVDLGDLASA